MRASPDVTVMPVAFGNPNQTSGVSHLRTFLLLTPFQSAACIQSFARSKLNKLKRDMYAQQISVKVHALANIFHKLFLSLQNMTGLKLFLNHGSSKHLAFVYLPSGPCQCTITITFESWNLHSLKQMIHSYTPLSPMI